MSSARLSSGVEASALLGIAAAHGGFGTILRKGDPDRGTLLLAVLERGKLHCCLERTLSPDGRYGWSRRDFADSVSADQHLARATSNDPDMWAIELDVPSAERFIAEMNAPT